MSDKITELTENTAPAIDDLLAIVKISGTPETQKIEIENLFKAVNGLTADGSPNTSADYLLAYDASAGAAKKVLMNLIGGGGGGMTISSASVTTSNVTGVAGTLHNLDLSGLTANRDFNLPTPSAANELCAVRVAVGDSAYALLVKVNSTEVTRVFITGEILVFQSTGTGAGDWVLIQDGLKACVGVMERQAAQAIPSGGSAQVEFDTAVKNTGDICDVTTDYNITIRRAGLYRIQAYSGTMAGIDDGEIARVHITINGTAFDRDTIYSPAASASLTPNFGKDYELAVGDEVEMYIYHTEGADVNTNTTYYPQLSVKEVSGAGGVGSGGGGGGDALTSNPLSQFAATTSAQLAGVISDETGSGALVFATSPTLVTPALGTPSALVLTNATGLPTAGLVDDAVTLAKLVNATAQYRLLGRLSASAGNFEEITSSANVFSLLQAADYAAMRSLLKIGSLQDAPNTSIDMASTSFVDLLSKSLLIAAGDTIEIVLKGEMLNNSGGTRTPNYQLDFDGVTVNFADTTLANSASARALVEMRATISVLSTSNAKLQLRVSRSSGVAANTVTSTDNRRMAWQTTATDVTGTVTVKLQVSSDAATATQTFYLNAWEIRVLNTSP